MKCVDLESAGLIEEVTGTERGKEYTAIEVLDILTRRQCPDLDLIVDGFG
ncbi:hypothetical protein ACFPYI_19215 [Halomarina salina]|uniref:Uncharacterized protein n=1 Tax=Halomarina salina TaxID=1872699 RepID=A0ABD5RSZ4_9EURY|nr:hypothetical protein [Halomarina salina]